MSYKKRSGLIILSIIAVILILVLILFFNFVSKAKEGEKILAETTFSEVDLSRISNGTYFGEYEAGLVLAKEEVTVEHGVLTNIELLEHRNGKGKPAERIIDEILNQQTTNIDVVSGATSSSLVIRKAIENALQN